ncbi:MAG: hypothetical protein WC700_17560 [Gemmatimonadaceae bacterium]
MSARGQVTSIYLSHDLRDQLLDRAAGGTGPGASIQTLARRYIDLAWRSRPTLAPAEWRLVCDALNGTWLGDDTTISTMPARGMIICEVEDAIRINGLGEKWGVDGTALTHRLAALTDAECESVRDVVIVFWARCGDAAAARVTAAGGDPNAVPGEPGWRESLSVRS